MRNDGGQISVTHLIQSVAFGEGVRLDFKVVIVRNALWGRFLVVTAGAVLVVERTAEHFLITKGDLFDLQFCGFARFGGRAGCELVAAGNRTQGNIYCELSAGVGEARNRVEGYSIWSMHDDERAGHGVPLLVINLHDDGLTQGSPHFSTLFAAARFDDGGSVGSRLGDQNKRLGLSRATDGQRGGQKDQNERGALHRFFASCVSRPFWLIRNEVKASASSSLKLRFGSCVPGRSACGSFSQL